MKSLLKIVMILVLILFLGLATIGCTNYDNGYTAPTYQDEEGEERAIDQEVGGNGRLPLEGELIPVEDLVADLTHRFSREDDFEYTEPLMNLPRDHEFVFPMTPEATERIFSIYGGADGVIHVYHFIRVYRDSAFTQNVPFQVGGDSNTFTEITYMTIGPPRNPDFPIHDPAVGGNLFHHGEFNDWGNANQYFLVRYYDFTTGERLQRPLVTVFDIATEIAGAPRIEFNVNEEGIAGLVWDPVPGATEYAVVRVAVEQNRNVGGLRESYFVDRTSVPYWQDRLTAVGEVNRNFSFLSYRDSNMDIAFGYVMNREEDEELTLDEFISLGWSFDFEQERFAGVGWYFGVIAFNSEGTSSISNLIDIRTLAPQVPISVATHLNRGGVTPTGLGTNSSGRIEGDVLNAPSHAWIIMADGNVSQYLIHYHIHMAREQTVFDVEFEYDEDGEPVIVGDLGRSLTLVIPYHIEGTSFRGYVRVLEYNVDTFEEELLELEGRQEGLRIRTGDLQRNINLNPTEEEDVEDGDVEDRDLEDGDIENGDEEDEVATHLRGDFEIFASSRLSAYLAIQMLNSQTRIILDDFPEAADREYLVEAWFEAVLQNPLILGARGMQLCWLTGDILITYDQNRHIQQRQQRAIKERVDEIVDEIITPGMTDLEKQTAINYFLIGFATYDFDALDNAAQNNFTHVDPEFYDSFTAYGILINGVGVCSGYADAFTLIATRAGLESVIVTGFLQGSLPHAWNRVNIDGQWYTLDVTNNDNEFFPNAFFNLSDQEASAILTEDTQWMLNRELPRFVATSDALTEYYRYNQRFFDQEEIVDALVAGIKEHGRATYRTNVLLTEEQFQGIMLQVVLETGNVDLLGGHFLGIITIME